MPRYAKVGAIRQEKNEERRAADTAQDGLAGRRPIDVEICPKVTITLDGLCGECRERQHTGLPEPASLSEFKTATERARQAIAGSSAWWLPDLTDESDEGTSWGIWGGVCARDRQQAIQHVTLRPHRKPDAITFAQQLLTTLDTTLRSAHVARTGLGLHDSHSSGRIA
ncbi:hypothetical protein [Saccharopolyspora pogona]|uniref:hypothetical protein n=1 Tax=Saccharopolyspora pogona TaxID=333966 RepID=UPI0016892A5B|nr:hypothetical protein [Saccharopolyspora pogona]